jgi:hypothetical protein
MKFWPLARNGFALFPRFSALPISKALALNFAGSWMLLEQLVLRAFSAIFSPDMSTVSEIENALSRLSREEMLEVHEWIENVLEDQLVMREEFVADIEQSKAEMDAGKKPRVRETPE